MKSIYRSFLFISALGLCSASSLAQEVSPDRDMSAALAERLAKSALSICHADNKTGVVAVVDRGGNLVILQRDDDVGPHNTLAAQKKAFTALSTKSDTRELARRAAADPETRNLNTVPDLLLLGGGVPVKSGDRVIGAIGVAGTGGPADDQRCAAGAVNEVFNKK